MTNTANINTPKGKITLALVTFLLALFASAALQSPALAETAPGPSTTRDSVAAGAPKHKIVTEAGKAVRDKQTETQGPVTSKGTFTYTSGRPGAIVWNKIVGMGWYSGNQKVDWRGSAIYRSPSYSGTQVITEVHKIYKWNFNTQRFDPWVTSTSRRSVAANYYAQMPEAGYQYNSSTYNETEYWFVDIDVKWQTPGGALIAQRTIRTTNYADYACQFSVGLCSTDGTENTLVWLRLVS